jgi:hypothetical protein
MVGTSTTSTQKHRAATVMSVVRMCAGGISWASPTAAWRVFGLGHTVPDASTGMVARLFGIRDFVLGAGVHHPDPGVRRSVLQAGVICDTADVVSSLIAVRAGASKATLITATAGAASFVVIGLIGLRDTR